MKKIEKTISIILLSLTVSCGTFRDEDIDSVFGFIVPLALEELFSDQLDDKHFVLDTTGTATAINYSFEPLMFGQKLVNSMNDYKTNHSFSNGNNWIVDFQNSKFSIDYNIKNETIGLVSITEPVLTTTNQVLLYIELNCGNDCGGGNLYLLDYEQSKWRIVDQQKVWSGKASDLEKVKEKFGIQ